VVQVKKLKLGQRNDGGRQRPREGVKKNAPKRGTISGNKSKQREWGGLPRGGGDETQSKNKEPVILSGEKGRERRTSKKNGRSEVCA